jgi:hypothetical protein
MQRQEKQLRKLNISSLRTLSDPVAPMRRVDIFLTNPTTKFCKINASNFSKPLKKKEEISRPQSLLFPACLHDPGK